MSHYRHHHHQEEAPPQPGFSQQTYTSSTAYSYQAHGQNDPSQASYYPQAQMQPYPQQPYPYSQGQGYPQPPQGYPQQYQQSPGYSQQYQQSYLQVQPQVPSYGASQALATAGQVGGSVGLAKFDARVSTPRGLQGAADHPSQGHSVDGMGQVAKWKGQDFYALREQYYRSGRLFEDPEFSADESVLYRDEGMKDLAIEWRRPTEIIRDPRFFVGQVDRFDINQGSVGDCWLVASMASLTLYPELLNRNVPRDQDFTRDENSKYAGIFHFRFWHFGQWVDVVVDDRLPYSPRTQAGLVYMRSNSKNEFWSALFEKAYAKLYTSYRVLDAGSGSEGMEDFTGGITTTTDLRQDLKPDFFQHLVKATRMCSLMTCSITPDPNRKEAELPNGLIQGHEYSLTSAHTVQLSNGSSVDLVRVRNPWGDDHEWKGDWSDRDSNNWRRVSEQVRQQNGITFANGVIQPANDGEFWMSYKDFISNYHQVQICHLGGDSLPSDGLSNKDRKRYIQTMFMGSWTRPLTSGGSRKPNSPDPNAIDRNCIAKNPQYRVSVVEPDSEDHNGMGVLVVGLMQKDRRSLKKDADTNENLLISYFVYDLKPGMRGYDPNSAGASGKLPTEFFLNNKVKMQCPVFTNSREVVGRHHVPLGEYLIVPFTDMQGDEAQFILRVFSESTHQGQESDTTTSVGIPSPSANVAPPPTADLNQLKTLFSQVAGTDGEVDAWELQRILNAAFKQGSQIPFDGFGVETARSILALFDADQSGRLGVNEFISLWRDLRYYESAFKQFDSDRSGKLSAYELPDVYAALNMRLSNRALTAVVKRFANRSGELEFDSFVLSIVRIRTVFDTYRAHPKDQANRALFDSEEFMQLMLYV